MKSRMTFALAILFTIFAAAPALATDGYFQLGYGTPYVGQAGAGVALSLNTMAPATNPAANAFILGYDVDLGFFNPNRQFTVTGNPSGYPDTFGLQPGTVKSGNSLFLIPGLGANWKLNDTMTLGVAIYGNGGMNTSYAESVFYAGRTGVNLSQMFIAPTFTITVAKTHAFGITPIVSFQRFQAEGVQSFAPFSSSPGDLSNKGYDESFGVGLRVGYLGKLTPWLSVGASYQTETEMARFKNYSGLFAEQGDFDIPSNWTVGLAVKPVESLTFAFDVQEIYYSHTESIGNPMLPNLMTARLGDDGGAGFGWHERHRLQVRRPVDGGRGAGSPGGLRLREAADPRSRGPLQHPRARRHRAARHGRRQQVPRQEGRSSTSPSSAPSPTPSPVRTRSRPPASRRSS